MPKVMKIDVLALVAEVYGPHLLPHGLQILLVTSFTNESMTSQKLFSLWRGEDQILWPQVLGHQYSSHLAWI